MLRSNTDFKTKMCSCTNKGDKWYSNNITDRKFFLNNLQNKHNSNQKEGSTKRINLLYI